MTEAEKRAAILVTGASGFVGRHLCRFLARRGYAVRGAVRARPSQAEEGVDYVAIGDIDDHTDWQAALDGIEIVIQAAGTTEDFTEPVGGDLVPTIRSTWPARPPWPRRRRTAGSGA